MSGGRLGPMSEYTIEDGEYSGTRLRVRNGKVEAQAPEDTRWAPAPLRKLARAYPSGEGPWPWLLERGVWRPTPSGGPTRPARERAADGNRSVTVWLTAEEWEALQRKRRGRSLRDTIGAMCLE